MKKNILTIILIFMSLNALSQGIIEKKFTSKPNYSENSEIEVIYKDSTTKLHSKLKPTGIFVNEIFIGNESVLNVINPEKVESLNIEKENFQKDGIEYYGKILIKMKEDYIPKFITISELFEKYLNLDKNPIVFQINNDVINQDSKNYLVDENFILKIVVNKIETSEKGAEINFIKLLTKTTKNINEANVIRIKGTEL